MELFGDRDVQEIELDKHEQRPKNFISRSWIRNRVRSSSPVKQRLRACWVTQAPVGLVMQPARWTRRLPTSMKHVVTA
jgi:hypothetical protein